MATQTARLHMKCNPGPHERLYKTAWLVASILATRVRIYPPDPHDHTARYNSSVACSQASVLPQHYTPIGSVAARTVVGPWLVSWRLDVQQVPPQSLLEPDDHRVQDVVYGLHE